MIAHGFDLDVYLEMLHECHETVENATIGSVTQIAEYDLEKECDEAVGKHEEIGDVESPQRNAAIIALTVEGEKALGEIDPDEFERGDAYLAEVAHTAAKYDVLSRVLDERAEAEKAAAADGGSR
ncbi:hypothetical protein [Halococcus sp. IIIV-5B]|uniref:hypothetical protein n=1 Tax=Halococcus sp. IIIV-5B TaxID=2321230 RepID=UPI000E75B766|nr:hypothetical protein [Halococcus sp. IIIV-5B]RJT04703.1 hypothetical protein D3261_08810 [Halococcus sp. IIIV-5B]